MSRPATLPVLSPPGFVGRRRELAALWEALSGPPAVVLVEGEAGIGKSSLLQQLLARQRVLVAACPPFREPYTMGPVVDAVRQATESVRGLPLSGLAGALRPLFPEWAADLPPVPEPLEDATAARHRLFRALVELLGRLEVTVLAVEDVHWADEATLEFLLFLVSRRPPPVSLVVTYRPEDVPADSLLLRLSSRLPAGVTGRRLVLGPLDVAETAELVSSMLSGEHVSAQFAAFLHERTEGVPLALEESVRLMHDRADLTHVDGAWVRRRLDRIDVPPTIRDAVMERVTRLGADTQTVLRAAAVLTDPADLATLSAVARLAADRVSARLADAVRCGLLREDPRGLVSFRHSLACRTVYEAVPAQQRRILHLRAGQALAETAAPPVAQLARHFREAGEASSWCRYAEEAADLALGSGDEATAAALLHQVVVAVPLPVQQLVRLTKKIPFSSLPGPDPFSALVRVLRSTLEDPGLAPGDEAEVRFQLGRVLMVDGQYEAARREMELAVPHLPAGSVEAARARIFLGIPLGDVQPAAVHRRWLREAAAVAPSVPAHEQLVLRVDRTVGLLMLGDETGWAEARRLPAQASTPDDLKHIVLAHMNLGHMAMLWGRYASARRSLATALGLVNGQPFPRFPGVIAAIEARLDWLTGAWDGLADRAAALADADDTEPMTRSEAALVAGLLHAAAGDRAAAEQRLRSARAEGERRSAVDRIIETAAALAEIWLGDGRVDDALGITEEPVDIAVHREIWVLATEVAPVRVQALAAAGRLGEAAALVAAFGRALGRSDAPAPRAALALCEAVLAEAQEEYADAATWFAQAAAAWEVLPRPYDAFLARERQARNLLAAGREDLALALLSDVYLGLSSLGARHGADRVQRTLRAHGVAARDPRRGGRPSYGDRLSPRELDVVRLLVGGRTNRQIADALVVSTQTVGSHLRSAMRKLSVSSRTALALKAVELGLEEDRGHRDE